MPHRSFPLGVAWLSLPVVTQTLSFARRGKPRPALVPSCRHHLVTLVSVPGRALSWEEERPKSYFGVGTEPLPLPLLLPQDEQGLLEEEAEGAITLFPLSREPSLAHASG